MYAHDNFVCGMQSCVAAGYVVNIMTNWTFADSGGFNEDGQTAWH